MIEEYNEELGNPNSDFLSIDEIRKSENVADLLTDEALTDIAHKVCAGYEIDDTSRMEWKTLNDKIMENCEVPTAPRNTPWEGASNMKMPLIYQAAIGYSSRTIPEIIQSDRVVKPMIIGEDPQMAKATIGEFVCRFISWQLLVQSPDWESGLDKLLQILPILGTVFKKTYYSPLEKRVISELCLPDKVVVNQNCTSLETVSRVTHLISMYKNDIIERQRAGLFRDIELDCLKMGDEGDNDHDRLIELLEQHCRLDLDGDGYMEPYIVTVHAPSSTVLRIVPRFKKVEKVEGTSKIKRISAKNYFTDFHFLRSGDGSFYSIGFGYLLYSMSEAMNSIVNQLIDAGSLSNLPGGFYSRKLTIRGGEFSFTPGVWKPVDVPTGQDIAGNFAQLPVKEPSEALFKLLGFLLNLANQMSSLTETLEGQHPAQNVSQGTISALVEQGTKIFVAINKRVYRSLSSEFRKIQALNYEYPNNKDYRAITQNPQADMKLDFDPEFMDICPVADPTMSTDSQRLNIGVMLQQMQALNPQASAMYMLKEVLHLDDSWVQSLLPPPDPNAAPPIEAQVQQAKIRQMDADVAFKSANARLTAEQTAAKIANLQQAMIESDQRNKESMARIVAMIQEKAQGSARIAVAASKMKTQELLKGAEFSRKMEKDNSDMELKKMDQQLEHRKLDLEARNIEKDTPNDSKEKD